MIMRARGFLFFLLMFPLATLSAKDYFQNPELLAKDLQLCASNPSAIPQADCVRAKQARADMADLLLVLKTNSKCWWAWCCHLERGVTTTPYIATRTSFSTVYPRSPLLSPVHFVGHAR